MTAALAFCAAASHHTTPNTITLHRTSSSASLSKARGSTMARAFRTTRGFTALPDIEKVRAVTIHMCSGGAVTEYTKEV